MTTFWVETGFLGTYIIGCKKRNFDTHIVRIWCCRMHEHCCESSGPADAQGATLLPFYLWCHVQIPCGCNVNRGDPSFDTCVLIHCQRLSASCVVWSVGLRKFESEWIWTWGVYRHLWPVYASLIGKIDDTFFFWNVHPIFRQLRIWIVLLFQVGAQWSSARRQVAAFKLRSRTRVVWEMKAISGPSWAIRPKRRSPKHKWCKSRVEILSRIPCSAFSRFLSRSLKLQKSAVLDFHL